MQQSHLAKGAFKVVVTILYDNVKHFSTSTSMDQRLKGINAISVNAPIFFRQIWLPSNLLTPKHLHISQGKTHGNSGHWNFHAHATHRDEAPEKDSAVPSRYQ